MQTSGGEEPKVPGTEPISQERPVSAAVFFTVCTPVAIANLGDTLIAAVTALSLINAESQSFCCNQHGFCNR